MKELDPRFPTLWQQMGNRSGRPRLRYLANLNCLFFRIGARSFRMVGAVKAFEFVPESESSGYALT